jgi:hypothetical protein
MMPMPRMMPPLLPRAAARMCVSIGAMAIARLYFFSTSGFCTRIGSPAANAIAWSIVAS